MGNLNGKVALVTGGSKGIGAGISKALAQAGASVAVNYSSSKQGAEKVAQEIASQGGKAMAVGGDVSKAADVEAMVNAVVKQFGRLDILVNNSGVYAFAPLEAITEEHFHRHFNINLLGLLLVTQAAAKHFSEGGSVINISSAVTRLNPPQSAVYTGTKGAVDSITRVLAKELGPKKIRVNSINPGLVVTEGTQAGGMAGSDMEKQMVSMTPLGRVGYPDDIATAVAFLASDDAKWITGETINVSGGL